MEHQEINKQTVTRLEVDKNLNLTNGTYLSDIRLEPKIETPTVGFISTCSLWASSPFVQSVSFSDPGC